MEKLVEAYIVGLVGTFKLVLGDCGCAVLAADHVAYLGVLLGFGLSLLGSQSPHPTCRPPDT